MFEDIVSLLKLLPLPWIIVALSWVASGFVCKTLWQRGNDLQDKNLADVKESAQKLADLNAKITDTLQALINSQQGGKKRVR